MEKRIIAILGCTASGKGATARGVAAAVCGEIVSVDSMKVYRGMDIGTAKPPPADRAAIPHHLIDVLDPCESFSVAQFVDLADRAVDEIHERGRPAVVVGGTLLYFRCFYQGLFDAPSADAGFRNEIRRRADAEGTDALHAELAEIDPEAAERIHRNDLRRIERALEVYRLTGTPISRLQKEWTGSGPRRSDWRWTLIGLRRERDAVNSRINERVRRMMDRGLLDEARRLYDDPRGISEQAAQAVGYAELFEHFAGRMTLDHAVERIKISSRRLGKHQRTWLKRFAAIQWIDVPEDESSIPPERILSLID